MVTEEDVANMSPEQLQELQKQNCIFCHIISGKVASKKIYEDDKVLAILDINPANPGHILLLTKEHYQIMPQIPDDEISHIFMVAKAISHACLKALKVQGTNIFIANGTLAGQKASHFMLHIIPRMNTDGLKIFELPEKSIQENISEQIRAGLSNKINELFGIKREEPIILDRKTEKIGEKEENQKKTNKSEKELNKGGVTKEKKSNKEGNPGINLDEISNFIIKNEPKK
jgi:histidine triad (HIT) family protein